jgi:hypothetical protein
VNFTLQLWALIAGAISPLVAYVLNYLLPWTSDSVKQVAQGLAATAAGAIADLLDTGKIGFDKQTLLYIGSALLASLVAHYGYTRGSGEDSINVKLGGGRNIQDRAGR